jgi:OOP family OmpA-OmpF porin
VKDIKLICFFVFICFLGSSQVDSIMVKSATGKTLKKLGKSALRQNDPTSAITFFEAYLKNHGTDAEAMNYLAISYFGIRDYYRAQHMFLNAYSTSKEKAPEALYYHALMQKSNSQYDSARINFKRFKKEYKGSEKKLKRQAAKEIAYCDSVVRLVGSEFKIIIQHLDTTINKVNTEAAPVSFNDDLLVFTSLRTEKKEYITDEDTSAVIKRKLYYAAREKDKWKFKGEYGDVLNNDGYNVGNACFSPDRKRIYFTRCRLNYKGKMVCALYVSEKGENGWTEPEKLPKVVNSPKCTSTMPAVTVDPVKGNDIIYFVSDRKHGKGGLDIWYTIYDKKKNLYRTPKNAGSKVNTALDEITPFFDTETRTLYFSSNGLGGLGGFDIFRTKGDGKKWTGSENIGQPINTGADDVFYTISTNRAEGFFVSNRKGGNALKNSTCCDDIYYYKHSEYINITLKGNIGDMVDDKDVQEAIVEIYIKDRKTNDKFLVKSVKTDKRGNYKTQVEPGQDYYVVVKKEDFLGTNSEVNTKGITTSTTITKDMFLARKPKTPIHIPNVLYEFDQSKVVEASKKGLDSTVLKMMLKHPEIVVEIQAHTDSKGTEAYNLKLSQKRAESIVKYLITRGIAPERLKAQGYGESQPIAPNENADGSDNPWGRAKNRRTDFKIIGTIDDPDDEYDK